MSKNQNTPRHELVCGKLDDLEGLLIDEQPSDPSFGQMDDLQEKMDLISAVRHDCERMEAELASRKLAVTELVTKIDAMIEDAGNLNYDEECGWFMALMAVRKELEK